ncbi:hypothetical protein VDG05_12950 [Xanthomonas campestris pv. raphani]|uniref:hypothetical protein n=1 Tax=Xanthomonas campestris TaxID=339 RepID=UPI002B236CB4|nr:hypothetical protein [Xanthomonas campestris]MEA9885240.1 hypothetical protein [Xanthomonas campestris pv. raphani]MEB2183089.1 hypothetical protein [Xanthomonas campestris pv. campestris]
MSDLEEKIAQIERRLALLEAGNGLPQLGQLIEPSPQEASKARLVSLSVSNKRYDHGDYEDHIWFDCLYTLSQDSQPTRAVKGAIEFTDLFGDVKFVLKVTINDPITPGKPLAKPGIGFVFNQFVPEHQWMLATNLKDMQARFTVSNAIYIDGTSKVFA